MYNVTFSFVGENLASYELKEVIATGNIYQYVGENLGNYAPVIQLIAPNKLQVAVFNASYNPSKKAIINSIQVLFFYFTKRITGNSKIIL